VFRFALHSHSKHLNAKKKLFWQANLPQGSKNHAAPLRRAVARAPAAAVPLGTAGAGGPPGGPWLINGGEVGRQSWRCPGAPDDGNTPVATRMRRQGRGFSSRGVGGGGSMGTNPGGGRGESLGLDKTRGLMHRAVSGRAVQCGLKGGGAQTVSGALIF